MSSTCSEKEKSNITFSLFSPSSHRILLKSPVCYDNINHAKTINTVFLEAVKEKKKKKEKHKRRVGLPAKAAASPRSTIRPPNFSAERHSNSFHDTAGAEWHSDGPVVCLRARGCVCVW